MDPWSSEAPAPRSTTPLRPATQIGVVCAGLALLVASVLLPARIEARESPFSWGFGMGLGTMHAPAGAFGCSSPTLASGAAVFDFDATWHGVPWLGITTRVSIGTSSHQGHDVMSASILAGPRLDLWRFYAWVGSGGMFASAQRLAGSEGRRLEIGGVAAGGGVGYHLIDHTSWRLTTEIGVTGASGTSGGDEESFALTNLSLRMTF
jgi:hypothetical protein